MLIETINTKRLFFNELFIYRKNDNERVDKDFIITKTSRVYKSIETRRSKTFDQSNKMQNIRMRLKKILFTLTSKEVWLSSCESIKVLFRKEFYEISNSLRFELKIFNSKRIFSIRIKCLTSIICKTGNDWWNKVWLFSLLLSFSRFRHTLNGSNFVLSL
jgi:hypothetical protein